MIRRAPLRKYFALVIFATVSNAAIAMDGHYFITGSGGYSGLQTGNSSPRIHYYNGGLTDNYPSNQSQYSTAVVGVGLGYELLTHQNNYPVIDLGVSYYALPNQSTVHGHVIEAAIGDNGFLLYNYNYHIKTQRLMFEAQVSWQLCQFSPYINVGIGSAFNRSKDYSETPSPADVGGYPPLPPFSNKTQTQFAYQIGAGIGYAFNVKPNQNFLQEKIALGYRYVNSGNTTLGTRGAVYPYRISAGTLRSNEIYFTYTHLF